MQPGSSVFLECRIAQQVSGAKCCKTRHGKCTSPPSIVRHARLMMTCGGLASFRGGAAAGTGLAEARTEPHFL